VASRTPDKKYCQSRCVVLWWYWLLTPSTPRRWRNLSRMGWRRAKRPQRSGYRKDRKDWWRKSHYHRSPARSVPRLPRPIQTFYGWKTCSPPYLWSCYRSQTRYPTTLGPDISVITETAWSPSEIPWRYAQTRKDFPQQVAPGCTNPFCTKTWRSLTVGCWLPRLSQIVTKQGRFHMTHTYES